MTVEARSAVGWGSVEAEPPDSNGMPVLLREFIGRHADVPDLASILAQVRGILVGRWLRLRDRRVARRAHDDVADFVGVEVKLDVGVFLDVPDLDSRLRIYKE